MNIKKYIQLLLGVVVLMISIKPLLFTWNFILANYNLPDNKEKASTWIYKSLNYNPSAYKAFSKYHQKIADHLIVKSAICHNDINRLGNLGMSQPDILKIKSTFTDNFYLQHLLKNPKNEGKWQNLDEVSFELLADKSMNNLTLTIFEKIVSTFDREFVENLVDFCSWKGNSELSHYLLSKYDISPGDHLRGIDYNESIGKLKKIVAVKFKSSEIKFENNLLECPTFYDRKYFEKNWCYSDMSDTPPFSNGSFTVGLDKKAGNSILRMMGFYVKNEKGKQRPRVGAMSQKRYYIKKGCYLFSFDYLTKTGKEEPSIYLKKGIESVKLPASGQYMKKMVFILNNSENKHRTLRPLILIWGTGTMWIDNVYLGKITDPNFFMSTPYAIFIEEWK